MCTEFPEQIEGLRTHLTLVSRMIALTDVACFKHPVSTAMMKIENDVPCILHLHKRPMEKILINNNEITWRTKEKQICQTSTW
jgi:hypothetical protein